MTDQEKLSGRLTQVKDVSDKRARNIKPRILELTDTNGIYIPEGSTTEVSDFLLKGVATAGRSPVTILDAGTSIASADLDDTGHFTAMLVHQPQGSHVYTVCDADKQESSPWSVDVVEAHETYIEYVRDPDGDIDNGSSTPHNDLQFVGRGTPDQVVELVDNGIVIRLLTVDKTGHWSARVTNLRSGNHTFIARKLNGKESAPWQIRVEEGPLLSTQFGYGQGNYLPIKNGETTSQTAVVLVGTAKPYEHGRILSDVHEGVDFEANQYGVFFALVEGLLPGFTYRFVCRSEPDRVSEPWEIVVELP